MHRLWVSVFGAGYSPVAPGTCGSAVVAVIFLGVALAGAGAVSLLGIMLAVAVHGFLVTIIFGDRVISQYGPDPRLIVSDEQCGQAITYLWLWQFTNGRKEMVLLVLAGFVLFRLFDIIKVPPARRLEGIHGAWGVLLDDVVAGVYANIALQIIRHLGGLEYLWGLLV